MAWIAVATIGGAVVGGMMQREGASKAADAQRKAAEEANALQLQMFQQQRADQQPWREAGANALQRMSDPELSRSFGASDFQADPGYAFRMAEGSKALERSAAARGGLMGGAALKSMARFGQDLGSQEYGNAYNRFTNDQTGRFNKLASIAGVGQAANNAIGNAGMNYANNAGQNMLGMGNAQAAGIIGQANANAGMVGQVGNAVVAYNLMNQNKPQTIPPISGNSAGGSWGNFGNMA